MMFGRNGLPRPPGIGGAQGVRNGRTVGGCTGLVIISQPGISSTVGVDRRGAKASHRWSHIPATCVHVLLFSWTRGPVLVPSGTSKTSGQAF